MANSLAWVVGNATSWTPASEATLLGWWKADSLSLSDGDPVSSWSDSSSNGYTMTQSDSLKKPTYKINIKNGLPAVFFPDTTGQSLTSSMPSNSKPFTIAAVIFSNVFSGHFSGLFGTTTDGDLQWLTVLDQLRIDRQNVDTIGSPSVGFSDGSWYVCIATYNSVGDWVEVVNGTTYFSTNNLSFTGGGTTLMGERGDGSNIMDGYIGEIMKFSSVVSTSTIDTYLNGRWAVH